MIQMTTPTHRFALPINADRIADVRITYAQRGQIKLTKNTSDCVLEGQMVTVTLAQTETKLFVADENITIQINIKTTDGKRLASRKFSVSCEDNQDDEVM